MLMLSLVIVLAALRKTCNPVIDDACQLRVSDVANLTNNKMMKLAIASVLVGSAAAFAPAPMAKTSSAMNAFTAADLPGALAPVGFFDPLGFAEKADEKTLKRYREAEVTHG
eukprot:764278_1